MKSLGHRSKIPILPHIARKNPRKRLMLRQRKLRVLLIEPEGCIAGLRQDVLILCNVGQLELGQAALPGARKSPGPRSCRSNSAILKPSVVSTMACRRALPSRLTLGPLIRMQ
ncbi:MAG: hypothetical protein R3B47_19680 [Bacteroidia bacterium]